MLSGVFKLILSATIDVKCTQMPPKHDMRIK